MTLHVFYTLAIWGGANKQLCSHVCTRCVTKLSVSSSEYHGSLAKGWRNPASPGVIEYTYIRVITLHVHST